MLDVLIIKHGKNSMSLIIFMNAPLLKICPTVDVHEFWEKLSTVHHLVRWCSHFNAHLLGEIPAKSQPCLTDALVLTGRGFSCYGWSFTRGLRDDKQSGHPEFPSCRLHGPHILEYIHICNIYIYIHHLSIHRSIDLIIYVYLTWYSFPMHLMLYRLIDYTYRPYSLYHILPLKHHISLLFAKTPRSAPNNLRPAGTCWISYVLSLWTSPSPSATSKMGKMGEEFLEFCWHTYGETRNGGRLGKHIGFKIEND